MEIEPVFLGPFGFNFELFTIHRRPLKFFLDGYNMDHFMRVVDIVEAFGGKLSHPRFSETVIFSNPNHTSASSCNCYNIKFLTDSIKYQTLQKLEDYRIVTSSIDQLPNISVLEPEPRNKRSKLDDTGADNRESFNRCETSHGDRDNLSRNYDFYDEAAAKKIEDALKTCSVFRDETSQDCESHVAKTENNSCKLNYSSDYSNVSRIGKKQTEIRGASALSSASNVQSTEYDMKYSLKGAQKTGQTCSYQLQNELPSAKSTPANSSRCEVETIPNDVDVENKPSDETSCTAARVRFYERKVQQEADVLILNDSNSNRREKCLKPVQLIDLTVDLASTSRDFDSSSSFSDEESDEDTHKKSPIRRSQKQKSVNRKSYSEEDNRRMVQYVIDNNAIQRGPTLKTWKEFLINKRLDKGKTSVNGLAFHYRYFVEKNYKKYTDDQAACQEFEKRNARADVRLSSLRHGSTRRRRCISAVSLQDPEELALAPVDQNVSAREKITKDPKESQHPTNRLKRKSKAYNLWTEEEYQTMINFLIDNNAIYRALSRSVWQECVQTSSLLQKSRRTANALIWQYRYNLRQNYAKYTNDPEALKRFQDMEIRRPSGWYIKRGLEVDLSSSN